MEHRVFSGIQPTGHVHLGNYLGAIRNWVALQEEYQSMYCIVDYHAVTMPYEVQTLDKRILEVAATNMAAGLDPKKAIIFVQSSVPEHTELAWLLTCITSLGSLERMTQFKDKSSRQKEAIFAGLMNYPVLQTADIVIYKADLVPVGEDQLQHLELAREIVRRFNNLFGEVFPEPKPLLTQGARVMALNNPEAKMSKSLEGSYIALTDEPDAIIKAIKRSVTDVGPQGGQMGPGVKNLFTLLEAFSDKETVNQFRSDYQDSTLRYSDLKQAVAESLVAGLAPIRERRQELMGRPDELRQILVDGGKKARAMAKETMDEVRQAMGFRFLAE